MKKATKTAAAVILAALVLISAGCAGEPAVTDGAEAGTAGLTAAEETTEEATEAATAAEPVKFELDLSKPLTAEGVKIHTLKCPEKGYNTAQGCCFDGECWVVAFNKFDQRGEECTLLCKFDTNGKLVAQSDGPLYLEHANNITYLPKKDAYYVTSCQGSLTECWNGYSIVDRQSLQVLEKGKLGQPFFAMGYCQERDAFASARWSGETLDFWDGELNHKASRDVTPPGTLSQGVFASPDSVWFVRSSQNGYKQEFRVYDWEGELLATIPLQLKNDAESESVNIVDGVMYVTSNGGQRANLFRVDFKSAE